MHLNCFWNLLECPIFWARFTGLRLRNFSSPNSFVFSFPFFFFAQVAKSGMWENDSSVKNSLAKARQGGRAGGGNLFLLSEVAAVVATGGAPKIERRFFPPLSRSVLWENAKK